MRYKKRDTFVMIKKNMPPSIINFSETEIEKLGYKRYRYPDPRVKKRFYCVCLIAAFGLSNAVIVQVAGLRYNSVGGLLKVKEYSCGKKKITVL